MSVTGNKTPIYIQDRAFSGNGNVYTGDTTRKQRRAMGMAGATYDAASSFNANSAGGQYLKEKGLLTDDGIDMSSRRNRRLLARAERKDRRQAMRDAFLTQTLGQTYQYGKVVKPEVKQETPSVGTENTATTKWSMPQTTLTVPTAPQNLFQMAHPVAQTTNTPINVSATEQAKDEPVKYTFSGFDKTWGDRIQNVYDNSPGQFNYGEMAGDDNKITVVEFKNWQKKHNLTPDGKIGYNTLNAMFNDDNDYSRFSWVKKPGQVNTSTSTGANKSSQNTTNTNTSNANSQTNNSSGGG